jgi:pSer/pThr/pTyr-binding forkhead associated (FHA) protein
MNEQALQLFRQACGLCDSLVLKCEEPGRSVATSADRVFDTPFVLVGRHPRSDLILDNAQISRRHAFLQAVAGGIHVLDLQSRTKVYWEGEEAPRPQGWLDHGRFIQVGPYRIRRAVCSLGEDQIAEQIVTSPALDGERKAVDLVSRASLELPFRMGMGPSLWPLDELVVLVGRSEACQFVLSDESVSRFHAALVSTPMGVWVVDLLAREGVHVNGERIRWAWLADGDSFRMGSFSFILRYESPPDQISRRDVPLEAGASAVLPPGTELAVRAAKPAIEQKALTVRSDARSTVSLKVTGFAETVQPAQLVPSAGGTWDPSIPFPPNPMAMWQQQMQLMESFHNDMILMVQMFVAMHREHLASVRHELDMVQRLTRELSDLQGKVTQSPESKDAGIERPSRESGSDRAVSRRKKDARVLPDQPVDRKMRTGQPVVGGKVPSDKGSAVPESAKPSAHGSGQIHAGLTERIAQLQRERQGYWQRILSTINK